MQLKEKMLAAVEAMHAEAAQFAQSIIDQAPKLPPKGEAVARLCLILGYVEGSKAGYKACAQDLEAYAESAQALGACASCAAHGGITGEA